MEEDLFKKTLFLREKSKISCIVPVLVSLGQNQERTWLTSKRIVAVLLVPSSWRRDQHKPNSCRGCDSFKELRRTHGNWCTWTDHNHCQQQTTATCLHFSDLHQILRPTWKAKYEFNCLCSDIHNNGNYPCKFGSETRLLVTAVILNEQESARQMKWMWTMKLLLEQRRLDYLSQPNPRRRQLRCSKVLPPHSWLRLKKSR